MVNRADFILAARAYVGTPFHHHGRLKGIGVDCLGLLMGAMAAAGFPARDYRQYHKLPRAAELIEKFKEQADEIPLALAAPGDTLLAWVLRRGQAQHILILSDLPGVIHCLEGGVAETSLSAYWHYRVTHAFRLRGLSPPGPPVVWPGPEQGFDAGNDPDAARAGYRQGGCC